MKKFRAPDSMHNRNVAQRKQFVVILNKTPENPNQIQTRLGLRKLMRTAEHSQVQIYIHTHQSS